VPLCQHADYTLDTDPAVVSVKLRSIITELRGYQRIQLVQR
jgi:hypothetical protein